MSSAMSTNFSKVGFTVILYSAMSSALTFQNVNLLLPLPHLLQPPPPPPLFSSSPLRPVLLCVSLLLLPLLLQNFSKVSPIVVVYSAMSSALTFQNVNPLLPLPHLLPPLPPPPLFSSSPLRPVLLCVSLLRMYDSVDE